MKILKVLVAVLFLATTTKAQDCSKIKDFSNICLGSDTYFVPGTGSSGSARDIQPGNDYGCLNLTPNSKWFYFKAKTTGQYKVEQTNTSDVDVDGIIWGPFDTVDDFLNQCGNYKAIDAIYCNYSSAAGFKVDINVQGGKYYVFLVNNYSRKPTKVFIKDMGSTASAYCDPDIAVQKTASTNNANVGDLITWKIKVTNKGSSKATNLNVYDPLPNTLEFVSTNQSDYDASTGRWNIGALAQDESRTLSINTKIKSTAPCGILTNKVTNVTLDQAESNVAPDQLEASIAVNNTSSQTPTFASIPTSINKGGSISLPNISDNNIKGTWTPKPNNTETTTYTFLPDAGQCAQSITKTIEVKETSCRVFMSHPPKGHKCGNKLTISAVGVLKGVNTSTLNYKIIKQGSTTSTIASGTIQSGELLEYTTEWPPYNLDVTSYFVEFSYNAGCKVRKKLSKSSVYKEDITPSFEQIPPIINGNAFSLPTVSTNGIQGAWSPAPNYNTTTTYTFTPTNSKCVNSTTMTVQVVKYNGNPTTGCSLKISKQPQDANICSNKAIFTSQASISTTSEIYYQWQYKVPSSTTWFDNGAQGVLPASGETEKEITATPAWAGIKFRVIFTAKDDPTCKITSEEAEILKGTSSNTATATGPTSPICGLEADITGGNTTAPTITSGKWTVVSKPTDATVTFVDDAKNTTKVSVNKAGEYKLKWTIIAGCQSSADITLLFKPGETVSISSILDKDCGLSAALKGTLPTGYSGQWSSIPSGVTFSPNNTSAEVKATAPSAIPYKIIWKVSKGTCSSSAEKSITFKNDLEVNITHKNDVCGLSTQLRATQISGIKGKWSSLPLGVKFSDVEDPEATAVVPKSGQYEMIWTVDGTCKAKASKKITFHDPIPTPTVEDISIVANQKGQLDVVYKTGSEPIGSTYLWSPTDGLDDHTIKNPVASPQKTTEYTVLITSGPCEASTQATVTVTNSGLIIPNVFTPNDDGVNDVWHIQNCNFPNMSVKVFNRWGNIVFQSTGYEMAWDGTYNSKKVPTGTYYFVIDPQDANSKAVKGSVVVTY